MSIDIGAPNAVQSCLVATNLMISGEFAAMSNTAKFMTTATEVHDNGKTLVGLIDGGIRLFSSGFKKLN